VKRRNTLRYCAPPADGHNQLGLRNACDATKA
jgi:hypothetical protein